VKTKWQLFLLLGLILLLTSSVIGCGESYTQEELDAAIIEGRNAGLIEGHRAGYNEGYDTGKAEGYNVGYAEGKDAGLAGLASAKQAAEKLGYDKGYDSGYEAGYDIGKKEGRTEGYDSGYQVGYEDGKFALSEPDTPLTITQPEEEQVIEDLTYIKASTWSYSDDADPEYEGVRILVSYYNSKSETIIPKDVSVEVTVELYWYTNFPHIYKEKVTIDYTGALTELIKEVIRIPFEGIQERPSGCTRGPILILTVNTPNQGNFEVQDTIPGFFWP